MDIGQFPKYILPSLNELTCSERCVNVRDIRRHFEFHRSQAISIEEIMEFFLELI